MRHPLQTLPRAVMGTLVWTLAILGATLGGAAWAAQPGPLSVFVSLIPQATFVERIGGDAVRVQAMIAPGQDPHAYEPTPRRIAELAGADLYWRIGVPFEDAWLPRIRSASPGLQVLDARTGIPPMASHPEGVESGPRGRDRDRDRGKGRPDEHDHEHEHGASDGHIWTSPPLVEAMGAGLRDALSALSPEQAPVFAANYERFAADLDALDREIRARLAPLKERRFLVFHPAWGAFAETYGLEQMVIERNGKEPGARSLAATVEQARAAGIRVVLVQPQMDRRAAERVAAAVGARVESVDPLAADYFGTLRRLADLIAEGAGP